MRSRLANGDFGLASNRQVQLKVDQRLGMCDLVLVTPTVRERNLGPDQEVLPAPGIGMTENLGVDLDPVKDLRDGFLGVGLDLGKDLRDGNPTVHPPPERNVEVEMSSNLESAKTRDERIRDPEFEKILRVLLPAKDENMEVVLRDLAIRRVRLASLA